MTERIEPAGLETELAGLADRVSALKQAREYYPDDLVATLDASLVELGAAQSLLGACLDEIREISRKQVRRSAASDREHKLLRQTFRVLPVPAFILDRNGAVRRINPEAAHLLGSPAGYLTGKPFPLFIDMALRAAFRTHFSSVLRTGTAATFETRLARSEQVHDVRLALSRVNLPAEAHPMIAAIAVTRQALPAGLAPSEERPAEEEELLVAAARRLDVMTRMVRLLLDEESLREPVAIARTARLMATELADWAVIDVIRDGSARRAAVARPDDQPVADLTSALERMNPATSPAIRQALESGHSVLHEFIEDDALLGQTPDNVPILVAMNAGSMLIAALQREGQVLGTLTLIRTRERPPFALADLGLLEDIADNLVLALRTERSFRRHTQAVDTLQGTLFPRELPTIAGWALAASLSTGDTALAGADFYDVYPSSDGLGMTFGSALSRDEETADAAALVRHSVRTLSLYESDAREILRKVDHALIARAAGASPLITALAALISRRGVQATLRLASAGHHPPALVRADGSVQFTPGGGVPLGSGGEAALEELDLASGDTLVIYSSGLTETRDENGRAYGEWRLTEALARTAHKSPTEVMRAVQDDRIAFSAGSDLDDVALLIMRFSPS